jgi:DNA repair exonuclease SbcCD ATPase subunit
MRIVNLQAENFKKLAAIDITPVEDMVTITGKNGAGKSSVLDAITAALCGGKAIDRVPIRKGEEKAEVRVDCGEFVVVRTFTKGGTYLRIESKDGHQVESPQKFLDQIVGKISFDPLQFINEEKDKQKRILLDLIGVDVDSLDQEEKTLREDRTITGREVKRQEALLKTYKWYPDVKEQSEISVMDATVELQEAMRHNNKMEMMRGEAQGLKDRGMKAAERVKQLQEEITELQEGIAKAKTEYREIIEALDDMIPANIEGMQESISNIEQRNALIRSNAVYLDAKRNLDTETKKYEGMTKQIAGIEKKRKELLDGAQMPVEGLTFDATELFYNGVPLDQASDGEKLMVSLGISMALNPLLRVLRIKDGSLLDEGNRAIIRAMLAEKDYQLWFETVGTDGKVGILIEEGEIVK